MAADDPGRLFKFDIPVNGAPVAPEEIEGNFEALARNNLTEEDSYPAVAREGMSRILTADPANKKLQYYLGGQWVTKIQNLGGPGVLAQSKLVYEQLTPSASWVIDHNFGSRVAVAVFDSSWIALPQFAEFDAAQLHVGSYDLTNPPLAVGTNAARQSIQLPPYAGRITRYFGFVSRAVVNPGSLQLYLRLMRPSSGNDIAANSFLFVGAAQAMGTRIDSSGAISGVDAEFSLAQATGADLRMMSDVNAPASAGTIDAYIEYQRASQCKVAQVNDNRVIVTHPAARTGYAVVIG